MTTTPHDTVMNVARMLIGPGIRASSDQIQDAVNRATLAMGGIEFDRQAVIDDLEAIYQIWTGPGATLASGEGHIAWLDTARPEREWRLWKRYRQYLAEVKHFPPQVLDALDQTTDDIVGRLEDPRRPGAWDTRGMVVGHVQSGKTANYTAVINKAIDAGYQLVIVLAGRHNNLRSQTQQRIDEGVLGYDTQVQRMNGEHQERLGVGNLPLAAPGVITLTSSHDRGDFTRAVAQRQMARLGTAPMVLVVKKVKSILDGLRRWCATQGETVGGRQTVRNVPILIIDDEADDASINTRLVPRNEDGSIDPNHSVTAINGAIRRLLDLFEQSAYVAYTATPYANIYIDHRGAANGMGADLFPRNFIISLPKPSNYIGPEEVFGLSDSDDPAVAAGLDIVRTVDDWQGWIPEGHDRFCVPGETPESLRRAIRVFVLVCAARRARGQLTEHSSMLVHVTRFNAVQEIVARQVRDELRWVTSRLEHEGGGPVIDEMEAVWNVEFAHRQQTGLEISWEAVRDQLRPAALKIRVKEINGFAGDTLEYYDHRHHGLSVIAIGGDKLSRGLTLEGLSVSYYLRASRTYDTLMQMGRWFGYRPNYTDLCRLYTTQALEDLYEHITRANAELRRELEEMALRHMTPEQFGLRIQSHPALAITAAAKMRNGTRVALSYAGDVSETVAFNRDPARIAANRGVVEQFLEGLGDPTERADNRLLWRDVGDEAITDLLTDFRVHEDSRRMQPALLRKYIAERARNGRLKHWTVALITRGQGGKPTTLAGETVGMIERAILNPPAPIADRVSIRRLLSPTDEQVDLDARQLARALEKTREHQDDPTLSRPGGPEIRSVRDVHHGLLLLYPLRLYQAADPARQRIEIEIETIGLAISFPNDPDAPKVEYVVNNIHWEEEFGENR